MGLKNLGFMQIHYYTLSGWLLYVFNVEMTLFPPHHSALHVNIVIQQLIMMRSNAYTWKRSCAFMAVVFYCRSAYFCLYSFLFYAYKWFVCIHEHAPHEYLWMWELVKFPWTEVLEDCGNCVDARNETQASVRTATVLHC